MIDLDFLSTSSSDRAGLSGGDTAHMSGFTVNEMKKSKKSQYTRIMTGKICTLLHWFCHGDVL